MFAFLSVWNILSFSMYISFPVQTRETAHNSEPVIDSRITNRLSILFHWDYFFVVGIYDNQRANAT